MILISFLGVIFLFVCDLRLGEALLGGLIEGGSYPKLQIYPHSAFLSISCLRNDMEILRGEWFCGASIVHKLAMLTAAHCIDGCLSATIVGSAGNSPDRRFTYPAESHHLHPNFQPKTFSNNIAVVALAASGLTFSDVIKPFVLKSKIGHKVTEAYLAGWGFVNITERRSNTALKHTQQQVYSRALCEELLGPMPWAAFCSGNHFVGHHADTEGGSPLTISCNEGYTEVGLISYQMPNISLAIHVFTYVPMYYNWIQGILKNLREEIPKRRRKLY